jgi:RHS repeat-associated protein
VAVDGNGSVAKTTYDVIVGGLVETAVTDPLGKTVRARVDALGRQRTVIDQMGQATVNSFDPGGNLLVTRDPNGVGRDCLYSELDQTLSCMDTQGDRTAYEYDAGGNVTATVDGMAARQTCTYDTLNRRTSCKDRNNITRTWAYDKAGNITTMTDGQGGVTKYTYNGRGLKTSATFPDSASSTDKQSFAYDGSGHLTSKTLQNGNVISFSYDLAGRLKQRTYPDAKNDTFTYDLASRLKTAVSARYGSTVAFVYDKGGRPTKESLTFETKTYDVTSTYDAGDRLTKLRYPDATEISRGFTDRHELATLAMGTRSVTSYAYDLAGRLKTTTLGNGLVETNNYRPDDLLASRSTPGVGDYAYTYDQEKRKLTETGTATPGGNQSFGYDTEGRLTSWSRGTTTQSWVLSAEGDWVSTKRGSTTETRTHNTAHEITAVAGAAVAHDSRGNMTTDDKGQKMAYDPESRLQTVTKTNGTVVTYFYDALGRKVAKKVGTNTTVFVNSGAATLAEYLNGVLSIKYIFGSGVDSYVAFVKSGKLHWYTRNHLGTVTTVTDELKAVKERYHYTAFGERTILSPTGTTLSASAVGNQVGFTSRYHDADTALVDFRSRHYHPRLGRFIARDDQYRDGANLYMAYFAPNGTDPTGHAVAISSRGGTAALGGVPLSHHDLRSPATAKSACSTILFSQTSDPSAQECVLDRVEPANEKTQQGSSGDKEQWCYQDTEVYRCPGEYELKAWKLRDCEWVKRKDPLPEDDGTDDPPENDDKKSAPEMEPDPDEGKCDAAKKACESHARDIDFNDQTCRGDASRKARQSVVISGLAFGGAVVTWVRASRAEALLGTAAAAPAIAGLVPVASKTALIVAGIAVVGGAAAYGYFMVEELKECDRKLEHAKGQFSKDCDDWEKCQQRARQR